MRDIAKTKGVDCVAGVGGGSAIDTAKATAYYQGLPVLVIPTVSATDAPCTGLSVIYKDDGSFSRYLFLSQKPRCGHRGFRNHRRSAGQISGGRHGRRPGNLL